MQSILLTQSVKQITVFFASKRCLDNVLPSAYSTQNLDDHLADPSVQSNIHTPLQGDDQHIRSSLGFNILPMGTSTCRPGASNQQPSDNNTLALHLSHSCPNQLLCSSGTRYVIDRWISLCSRQPPHTTTVDYYHMDSGAFKEVKG